MMTTDKPLKPPALVDVPWDSAQWHCEGCGVLLYRVGRQPISCEPVYTYKGRSLDMAAIGVRAPTPEQPGKGWNHFADCPHRDWFKRPLPAAPRASVPRSDETPRPTPAVVTHAQARAEQDPALLAAIVRERAATKAAGLACSWPDCTRPPVVCILTGERGVRAFPCEEHTDPALEEFARMGHTTRLELPTTYLANADHPEWREPFIIRVHNTAGAFQHAGRLSIPPASHGSRRGS
jgi:hypothetical protein